MDTHLFKSFSKMINDMPPRGVIPALELQCQMLTDDLAQKRLPHTEETHSILSYQRFLKATRAGNRMSPTVLSAAGTAFFRKTTERLVEAGELPSDARDRFDAAFSIPLLDSLIGAC